MYDAVQVVRGSVRLLLFAAVIFLTGGLLVACGGGGSSSGSGSGGDPAARSFGEIESLGSIVVNGVKYEVEDGLVIGPDNLTPAPGMVVEVEGRINDDGVTGIAREVKFDDNVKGPLTGPLTGDDSVKVGQVMGQTVIFEDNLTKFDPATGMPLDDDINKVFMISGFDQGDGSIQATFVRVGDDFSNFLNAGGILEVTGTVSNLNSTNNTFMINDLTVDYSTAMLRDLPAAGLSDGLLVKVKGEAFVSDPNTNTNTLTAIDIEGKARGLGDDTPKVHVEGFIADLNTAAKTFTLNGQPVNYTNASFRAGEESDLADGIKVEAEGPLSNGALAASRVTFKASVRIEAAVATKSDDALTFVNLPSISVLVHPELTRGADAFAGINVGTAVKVRARLGASDLVATRLENEGDTTDETIIRGPVTSIAGALVTILGTVVVNTDQIGPNDFKDHDTVIGSAEFFARLKAGDIVKARIRDNSWDQIEFQD